MESTSETLGRRERKKLELERRIRAEAARLFHEKGYDETTVEEIAEAADVSRGTLFNYFPRKDTLLLAVWEDSYDAAIEALGPMETWEGTGPEQLRRLFHAFAVATEVNPRLSRVMLIEAMRRYWLREDPSPREREFRELVERMVEQAQARGELDSRTEPRIGGALLREVYGMTVLEWLKRDAAGVTLRGELDARFDVVFRGLGARGADRKGGGQ